MTYYANSEIDVLIAGFVVAGASAAIEAHDAGARVLIVEKTSVGGGNCRWSGGFLYAIDGPSEIDHLDAVCFGRTDRPVLEAYAAGTLEIPAWIESLGGSVRDLPGAIFHCPWPHFPGGGKDCVYRQIDAGQRPPGPAMWEVFERAIDERGIEVVLDTSIAELIVEDGTVHGAVLESGGERRSVTARAVVLASGGIEFDPELRETYLTLPVKPIGHPGNTGDSIRLAQQAGATLWHMAAHFGWLAYSRPEYPSAFGIDLMFAKSYIAIDQDGMRFSDETGRGQLRDFARFFPGQSSSPRARAYFVFDETARLTGSLNGIGGSPNDYKWSQDNSAEVAAGWITRAESPAELAAALGIDRETLVATLADHAKAAANGEDPLFNRPADTLAALEGPLYAIEVVPGLATASGGPRRDARSRVLRPGGEAIPGLMQPAAQGPSGAAKSPSKAGASPTA